MSNNEKIMNQVFGNNLKVLVSKTEKLIFPMFEGFNKTYEIIKIVGNDITKIDFILKEVEEYIFFKTLGFDQMFVFDISQVKNHKIRLLLENDLYVEYEMTDLERTNDLR